jgi:exodeoxyribonuclease VII small subunit
MTPDPATLSFEAAFRQLEAVVARLEAGGLGLEEALALYEEGMQLLRACIAKIEAAELRLLRLQDLEGKAPL